MKSEQEQEVLIPFLNSKRNNKPDSSYLAMLHNRICPNFQLPSLTTLLILGSLVLFIMVRIGQTPSTNDHFLSLPSTMNSWALDVQSIRNDRTNFYETITAILMHSDYAQLVINIFLCFFLLYQIEFCWRLSIVLALLSGFAANCLAVAVMEGLYMGLNGTIYACVGIQLAASILHCAQLRAKYGMQFYITLFFSVMLVVTSMGFTDSPIIQFFGFAFGFLFGLAFHPRMPNANVPQNADKLLKIFAFVLPGIAFILGIII